ncbi:DNA polymerase III subunit gamma/tau [Prevotella sp. Rep29]|uniref:DNA polymerase III subunit gamma/tau n=1 Tax=Prevotella sp. Rep29 TaxID=2691580 RepID=UPI001C6E0F29|nr:DNA polymerase III subunit gamma/tau [Prevotella sp. Rep29]QYR10031.1 DNA polymerase III subunit gamma/tau [Prevotella sp. Rep29]
MEYIVSARKYRPMTFDSVVGQEALTTTLKNAVKSGKLAHAYLFCGPRGVGKTTCARIFAKAINCSNPTADGEACGECESCQAFNNGRSYNIFELDAASNNGVDQMKTLMEQTRIPPQIGKYKVFIIDEVHMLSAAAFNSFLKTLEEPPSYVIFILATTEKHKILPTIISRCQIFDFDRMTVPNIIAHLKQVAEKEGITYEEEALGIIAEKADGGMRDALSIFDQVASYSQGNITLEKVIEDLNVLESDNHFRIIDLALENKVSDIMLLLNDIINKGFDPGHLINGLAAHVRNVMMAKDAATLPLLEVSQQQKEKFQQQAQKCPTKFLYAALRLLNNCEINYRQSSSKRLLTELTLIEVAQLTQEDEDVPGSGRRPARRLKTLFKKLAAAVSPKSVSQVTEAKKPETNDKQATTGQLPPQNVPTPKKKINLKESLISLKNLNKKEETKEEEKLLINQDEQNKFTQDDLEKAWYAMCSRMPRQMTATAMRLKNIVPKIADYPNIELVIDNQLLIDEITPIKGRIQATMAKDLHNGSINFTLRLAEIGETKIALTKKEQLEDMKKSYSPIKKLSDALQLEII